MACICRNYAKNKNVLLFYEAQCIFRWHWYDDDDDNNNNNNSSSSEDIVFIIVFIIVSITRFTALSHMMLLIFATFELLNIFLQLPIDFTYNTWLSNSLDKRLEGQSLPGSILTLFLCSYYFSCPVGPTSLFSLSFCLQRSPRSEDWPGMIYFSKQFPGFLIRCPKYRNFILHSVAVTSAFSNTQSLVFFADYDTLHICRSPFILKTLFCY